VYSGSVLVSAVDENGKYQDVKVDVGDIWYFPKGAAHTIQGREDENKYLLVFDGGNFDALGTTFMVNDWIAHTPKNILAKNFRVSASTFDTLPTPDPYILNATVTTGTVTGGGGPLIGNSLYVHHMFDHPSFPVPGQGGTFCIIDSRNFPISTTIAATFVTLEPKSLRELHRHPGVNDSDPTFCNHFLLTCLQRAEEWLYFYQGHARTTVFIGDANSHTFDFSAGDTAVFPDNSGHYIENTSETYELDWIEIHKSDRVADISLSQWLTPP